MMKASILVLSVLGLVGVAMPGHSEDGVPVGPAWRPAPVAVGHYLGSQTPDARWARSGQEGVEGDAIPGDLEGDTSALADSSSETLGKYCSTNADRVTCSTEGVKKCSTTGAVFCSTQNPVTCSTTTEEGTTCTAFGAGKCSTTKFACSAKGKGKCSAEGNGECSATGNGYCSVHKGEGGTCTSLDGQGKCSTGMGGPNCSTWDDDGNMTPPGPDGTCSG